MADEDYGEDTLGLRPGKDAHEPGSLVRSFTADDIDILIRETEAQVRFTLSGSFIDLDKASLLVSRLFGLRMVRRMYG